MGLTPPKAKQIAKEITQHGEKRIDNYAWLRDDHWKKFIQGDLDFANPDVKEYLEAENAYTESVMDAEKPQIKELYDEILGRIKEDDESCPFPMDEYLYYHRTEKGKDYPIHCRKKGENGAEEIYFDTNKEAAAHKLYMSGPKSPNKENLYFAYTFNLSGSLERTLKVRNFESGKDFDWEIENTTGSFTWVDNENILYVERDESGRGKIIYKFNIHEGPSSAKPVFTKPEVYQGMFMGMGKTTDRKYVFVYLKSGSQTVLYMCKNEGQSIEKFDFFAKGENDVQYSVEHHRGQFYILTNMDGCHDFKIMTCKVDDPKIESWQEYMPETKGRCHTDFSIYSGQIVLLSKNNEKARLELSLVDIDSKESKLIEMQDECYDLRMIGADDAESQTIQLTYASPIRSEQTLELNLSSHELKVLQQKEVPNFNSDHYVLKRLYAPAHDGEMIPLTVVHKKDLELDGKAPAFVYAYGSYGITMPSYFSSTVFSLIDRGFVYAIAHIRGGSDKGFQWYLDGKMHKKLNTFKDYISACEFLCDQKYTQKGQISARGGSAGGLLMGTVTNMRPDLFASVVADVAFVDMINTISDETLPLTPPEWEEWGNPIKNKDDYKYMMQYSPYDNVEAKDYPPMLYNSGISDEQVTYWEPTKMVAKLREMKTDDNLLMLRMKMHAGHAGASKRYEWIEDSAFSFAFILKSYKD